MRQNSTIFSTRSRIVPTLSGVGGTRRCRSILRMAVSSLGNSLSCPAIRTGPHHRRRLLLGFLLVTDHPYVARRAFPSGRANFSERKQIGDACAEGKGEHAEPILQPSPPDSNCGVPLL